MVLYESTQTDAGTGGRKRIFWHALDILKGSLTLTLGFYVWSDGSESPSQLPTPEDTTEWLRGLKDPG